MTMTIKQEPRLVYESPDGGQTIYARKQGSPDRTLIHQSMEARANLRWYKLKEIVHLAQTDPVINDALSKLEMLYVLKKEEN